SGVWPCKINGCNKQFAREADLKRHQRTTKLHSIPGLYVCWDLLGVSHIHSIRQQSLSAMRRKIYSCKSPVHSFCIMVE
ncbi:hypothetical protein PAXRUDRAFT_133102, partial [Paxillus rubicundulus Ve08.2h10]